MGIKIEIEVPVVPRFVADWFEESKHNLEYEIFKVISNIGLKNPFEYLGIEEWFNSNFWEGEKHFPIETVIKMQYGYTIEQEQLYTAKPKVASLSNWRNEGKNWLATEGGLVWLSTNSKHGQTLETWNSVMVTQDNADFEKMEN